VKFVVLSDTHMNTPSEDLEKEFETRMWDADALFHCGDYTGEDVWAYLNSHENFFGVAGNMDYGYWSSQLPRESRIRIGGISIGILHGFDLDIRGWKRDLLSRFPEVHLVLFGHTHMRTFQRIDNRLWVLNPGSFTFAKRGVRGYALIFLSEDGDDIKVEWVDL